MPTIAIPGRKTTTPIGVDLGRTGVRLAQLVSGQGRWHVKRLAHWAVSGSTDAEESENVANALAVVSGRLNRSIRRNEFAGHGVVVGLSQPDLELHALELPEQSESGAGAQVAAAARWEIERLSQYAEGTTETAQWRLPTSRSVRTTAVGVAVPSATVTEVWTTCRGAKAACHRIDAAACALVRAGVTLRSPRQDEVWGVLDLGARGIRLILCVDEVPVLVRSLEGGGLAWTAQIAETLKVSPESAELHKRDHGIRHAAAGGGSAGQGAEQAGEGSSFAELAGMIFTALRHDLDRISAEIVRSYDYILGCYSGRKAADLILAGGSAALKNLDAYLAERLGIPVHRPRAYLDQGGSRLAVDESAWHAASARDPLDASLCAIGLCIQPENRS